MRKNSVPSGCVWYAIPCFGTCTVPNDKILYLNNSKSTTGWFESYLTVSVEAASANTYILGSAIKNLGLFSKSPGDFKMETMDF